MDYYGWGPYVSVGQRRREAERTLEQRRKQGHKVSPVVIAGRKIATTFWGQAWCDNLESYSDYSNRLPRGRTYVRNGSVVDLQISSGEIQAYVSGSHLYEVTLKLKPVAKERWASICTDCAGGIDSLVELLQGRLSKYVMERICRKSDGLFPAPSEIELDCSCPDGAYMCKHLAAVLYGIGAQLDHRPELLFLLRGVDEKELIAHAGESIPLSKQGQASGRVLGGDSDLAEMFGLEIAVSVPDSKKKPIKKVAVKKTLAVKTRKLMAKRANGSGDRNAGHSTPIN